MHLRTNYRSDNASESPEKCLERETEAEEQQMDLWTRSMHGDYVSVPTTSEWNSWKPETRTIHSHSVLSNILLANAHTVLMLSATWTHLRLGVCLIRIRIKTDCSGLAVTWAWLKLPFPHTLPLRHGAFTSRSSRCQDQPHTRQHPTASPTPSLAFNSPSHGQTSAKTQRSPTLEAALGLQVAHTEAKHRQLVQAAPDLLGERQQTGQVIQLHVQAVPVAFGRVGLHRRRLHTLKDEMRRCV